MFISITIVTSGPLPRPRGVRAVFAQAKKVTYYTDLYYTILYYTAIHHYIYIILLLMFLFVILFVILFTILFTTL